MGIHAFQEEEKNSFNHDLKMRRERQRQRMEIPPVYTSTDIFKNLIEPHKKKYKYLLKENSPKLKKGLNLKNKN